MEPKNLLERLERMIHIAHETNCILTKIATPDAEKILELLKAQEPRVMKPEEVAAVPEGGVIWEEIRRTGICEARIRHGNCFIDCADYLALDEVTDCDDYLKHYRCWTSRPTDEQRKAAKWDDSD